MIRVHAPMQVYIYEGRKERERERERESASERERQRETERERERERCICYVSINRGRGRERERETERQRQAKKASRVQSLAEGRLFFLFIGVLFSLLPKGAPTAHVGCMRAAFCRQCSRQEAPAEVLHTFMSLTTR